MKKNEIFTVENAKVEATPIVFNPVSRCGYIHEGDGIVYVHVTNVTINLKTREVVTILADTEGKEYKRNGTFHMYRSPQGYERGEIMGEYNQTPDYLISDTDKRLRCSMWITSDEATEEDPAFGYVRVWTFEDGEPKAVPVVVNVISKGETDNFFNIVDGHLPDNFWSTKDEAFSFNEYKVVDNDGEVFIEQGVGKRVALTDEQREIVDQMKALYDKAREMGVRFVWDRENCGNLEVYNGKQVTDWGYDAATGWNETAVPFCELPTISTGIHFYDYSCDSCDRVVFQQTDREKKEWNKEHPDNQV